MRKSTRTSCSCGSLGGMALVLSIAMTVADLRGDPGLENLVGDGSLPLLPGDIGAGGGIPVFIEHVF